jgi:hypothetical protein
MVYLYDACDQISDFCYQQLLRKMRRKISWTDGRTDGQRSNSIPPSPFGERGYKTVYLPPPSGSGGIIIILLLLFGSQTCKKGKFQEMVLITLVHKQCDVIRTPPV